MLRNPLSLFAAAVAIGGVSLAANEPNTIEPAVTASVEAVAVEATPVAAGAITGTITFEGEAPEAEAVDMSADPVCGGLHEGGFNRQHVRVGARGGLNDVFITLTDGVPDERYKAPKEPVVLDQKGCTYEPQVFGIVKKQDITIRNSDDTLHNIHAVPKSNKEFNVGMPTKGMEITKTFKKGEEEILIKCDVHPWMQTYCFTMEHPYFATTDANGAFSIDTSDLPDGEYGVKVWHRTLGERSGKVTVTDGAAKFDLKIKG